MRRLLGGLLFAPLPVWAAAPDISIATMLVSLTLVLALIFALAWLLRRLKLPGLAGQANGIRIISQLAVGQKERILVVDINGEQLVIGVTATNIRLLKALDSPMPTSSNAPAPNTGFAEQLGQLLNRK
ncbi:MULTISPECIES: flagellar biosynthetic protein FliO [Salinivibrio]|uniref:Flagellar protein n=1 Tax=Salinivibrio costicola TaxID=51367 RepID=A0ABX6K5A7_SALCS|nr:MULTISPECIES: flagellar biosynthetic protein FliO [Salinivibrio]OOF23951.1 flagellar biosynthetic protein FliO [Salinivibrio sp. IB574]QIR06712.1 flagellar biosynthetic protein FliO [Salinivibrio costicola]